MDTIKKFELKANETDFKQVQIKNLKDSVDYARQFYFDDIEIYESAFIILLNRANFTMGYAKISQGGICGTIIDVKIIAKYAIDSLASGIILIHNHPSNSINPSESDIISTKKVKNTLNIFECKLLDSIILTKDSSYSLLNEGIL